MVGNQSKLGSALSWADEVEKEEEEAAAQAQVHQKQKPNAFGSARPREVVLQEKGIDWRKLHHDLQQPSRLWQDCNTAKPHKESIPAPAAPIINKMNPPMRGLKQKMKDAKSGLQRSEVSSSFFVLRNQFPVVFVPPLRHPPKIFAGRLFETGGSNYLNRSDNGQPNFQYKNQFQYEKENRFHEAGGSKSHNLKSLDHNRHIHPHFDQQVFSIQRESKSAASGNSIRKSEELGQSTEALHKGNLEGNQQGADSAYERKSIHGWNPSGFASSK